MFGADVGDLGVAGIGALALIASASIPAWIAARKARNAATETKEAIGVPNGRGSVVKMLEDSLQNQGEFRTGMEQIRVQLDSVAAKQEAHSLDDHKRFRIVFDHLGIPMEDQ